MHAGSTPSDLLVAKVRGEFEAKRNVLLGTAAGRAYIAWQAAGDVKFASELSFASRSIHVGAVVAEGEALARRARCSRPW